MNIKQIILGLAFLLPVTGFADSTCTPEHASMGHCTMDADASAPAPMATKAAEPTPAPAASACTPEHASMGHCTMDAPEQAPAPMATKVDKPAPAKPKQAKAKPAPAPAPTASACTPEHASMGHCTMDAPAQAQAPIAAKVAAPAPVQPRPAKVAPAPAPVASACTPEHASMGHCTMDAPAQAQAPIAAKVAAPAPVQPRPAKVAPAPAPVASACTPEHASMGHCTMDAPAPAPMAANVAAPTSAPAASACTPEHASMGHCTMDGTTVPAPTAAKTSTCLPEHERMGHCKSTPDIPVSDGSLAEDVPMPFSGMMDMEDDPVLTKVMIDRFEWQKADQGSNPLVLEADVWVGKDLNKFWFKTELERVDGKLEEAEVQALYSRGISPYWDLQAGFRRDFEPVSRDWIALGARGIAPYFFDVDAAVFLGEGGRTAARLQSEYELMLTQKTYLAPEAELNFYGQDDPEAGVGSGLSDARVGLRLTHEISRKFAPYVGVEWSKQFGRTADFARDEGEDTSDTRFVVGVRGWF